MTLSEKDKKLLIFVGILGIICATYFFIYSPLDKKQEAIKNEINKLQSDYDVLVKKQTEKDKYEGELKAVRYQIKQNEALLPPDLRQEYIIHILREMEKTTGIVFGDLSFSEVSPITGQTAEDKSQSQPQAQQSASKQDNSSQQLQGQPAPVQQQVQKQVQDGTGIKMNIKTAYTASYSQVKSFLALVEGFENKVTITDISFKSREDGQISGTLALEFYGIRDSSRPVPQWTHEVDPGRDNIFLPFEGYITEAKAAGGGVSDVVSGTAANTEVPSAKKTNYDFILTASPYSSDVPSVILGYAKDRTGKGYVYSDSREFEQAELQIINENDTIYYTLKAGKSEFPSKNEKNRAVLDTGNGELSFHIISSGRNGNKDVNGVNLSIINNTDIELKVKIDYEDAANPRIKLVRQEGRVTLVR